ncbi:MAG: GIY-YIG nuclease family protein [Candidatus Omnitrophica bacterium]|nr:GIY-YIG nuclease family protein [Candidatus Omnitrophota bacterium]
MDWFTYVIRSNASGRHYIGVTSDLARRLDDHDRGKSRSVRGRGPLELMWCERHESRREATTRERQIKRVKGGEALKKLLWPGTGLGASGGPMSPSSSGRTPRLRRGTVPVV